MGVDGLQVMHGLHLAARYVGADAWSTRKHYTEAQRAGFVDLVITGAGHAARGSDSPK
jgi:hypothetical protein